MGTGGSQTIQEGSKAVSDYSAELVRANQALEAEIAERKRAEEARYESEERYRTLIETIPYGIQENDVSGTITFSNAAHHRMMGYAEGELVGTKIWNSLAEDAAKEELQTYLARLVEEQPLPAPYLAVNRTKDGRLIDVQVDWDYKRDEQGRVTGFISVITDITERKRMEQRVQRLLDQQVAVNQLALALGETWDLDEVYHTIYKHIGAMVDAWGFIVSFYDEETQLIRAEYAMYKGVNVDVTGFPPIPLAAAGQGTQSQVIHTGEPLYTPDYRKASEKSKTEYVVEQDGTISKGPPPEDEQEDSTRSALYVPMRIEGRTIGVMQLQSGRLDAYAQEDIHLLAALANVAAVAVQNARLFGDLKRSNEELEKHREHLEELVAGRTAELEERVAEIDQLNRALSNLLEDVRAASRKQEKTAARLREVNRELEDFAYVVSHDLKAPLRGIGRLADWLSNDYADALDEQGQEMLGLLIGRTQRMHDLIDGVLEYSRIGRVTEKMVPVDLNQLVDETIDILALPEHIQITIDDGLPTVVGERTRLGQVFQNLLSNAVKFMDKPEGLIRVGCVDEGARWLFSVADNGPGMDEKHYGTVFQMFHTLAPRDEFESTGVGLALVKKIVETWGGNVWVKSTVGQGSTFFFTLPRQGEENDKA
jgi:PAS domain S-box-containing protein